MSMQVFHSGQSQSIQGHRGAHSSTQGFTADLRRLRSWPSMVGSPWRQPYLAELTFGAMFSLVNKLVSGHKLRILEVGCGRGYLGLELARSGHELLGIDIIDATVKIAT